MSLIALLTLAASADAGLIAHWPMNETSGTAVDDPVGGFDGQLCQNATCPQQGATQESAKISFGLHFDGTDDLVSVAHNATLNSTASVAFWFKADTFNPTSASGDRFISKGDHSTADSFGAGIQDPLGSQVVFCYMGCAFTNAACRTSYALSNFSTGVWYHIVCAADGSGQEMFVDAVSRSTNATARGAMSNTSALRMGQLAHFSLPEGTYDGMLDDVRLYDHRLTLSEVQALVALGNVRRSRAQTIME